MGRKRLDGKELLVSFPSLLWLFMFFLFPFILIVFIAFHSSSIYGDILQKYTLANFKELLKSYYILIIWRTIWISLVVTSITISIGIPVGYYIARLSDKWKQFVVTLVVIPFWTNFLIRIFAWKLVLNPEGIVKKILVALHFVSKNTLLLYHPATVVVVMVYTYLPFAILPIYAASEKFDFSLLDAARDLGANRFEAFLKVFLPGISKGIGSAAFMVLIPSLGAYVIPDLVGGTDGEMIGNIIASRVFVARNIPMASAWSTLLFLIILLPMGIVLTFSFLNRKNGLKKGKSNSNNIKIGVGRV